MQRAAFLSMLTLERTAANCFRSSSNEPNPSGRVYGGQSMGQALVAALNTVPVDRAPTSLQILFLSGPRPEEPIDYSVAPLQDGKRVSSRHVRAQQGGRDITGAFVAAHAVPTDNSVPEDGYVPESPRHQRTQRVVVTPEDAVLLEDLSPSLQAVLKLSGFRTLQTHPHIEVRFVDPRQLEPSVTGTIQYWVRIRHELPADARLHAAALAYLSDWWLSFAGVAAYLHEEDTGFYMATLNHSLWFHAPARADAWLLVETDSPWANRARGLCRGHIFGSDGALVASVTQECLQTSRLPGIPQATR